MAIPALERVITTVGLVVNELHTQIRNCEPEIHTVYDEQLTYESAIQQFRDNNKDDDNQEVPYPLFAFKREALQYAEDRMPSKRLSRCTIKVPAADPNVTNEAIFFKGVHAQCDFPFIFFAKDIEWIEMFEIAYLGQEGITNITEIQIPLPDEYAQNALPYYLEWQPLESKEINKEGSDFKSVSGVVRVNGMFMIFKNEAKLITEITATTINVVDSDSTEQLEQLIITPE